MKLFYACSSTIIHSTSMQYSNWSFTTSWGRSNAWPSECLNSPWFLVWSLYTSWSSGALFWTRFPSSDIERIFDISWTLFYAWLYAHSLVNSVELILIDRISWYLSVQLRWLKDNVDISLAFLYEKSRFEMTSALLRFLDYFESASKFWSNLVAILLTYFVSNTIKPASMNNWFAWQNSCI